MGRSRNDIAYTPHSSRPKKCNHNPQFDHERYETVCTKCGLVLSGSHESSMEEAAVTSNIRRSPQCLMLIARNKGLHTRIGNVDYDASGKKLTPSAHQRMLRLKSWDTRVAKQFSADRKQAGALAELRRLGDKLNIHRSIREETARIYYEAKKENMIRGTPTTIAVPAMLYAACRVQGNPRTLREILKESLANTKAARIRVARFYRRLLTELGLQPHHSDPITYVSKVAESMRISGQTQGLAIQILKDAKKKHLDTGKDPSGLVAAALYIASLLNNKKIKQKEISKVAGVADATVRHHCKVLRKGSIYSVPGGKKNSLQAPEE